MQSATTTTTTSPYYSPPPSYASYPGTKSLPPTRSSSPTRSTPRGVPPPPPPPSSTSPTFAISIPIPPSSTAPRHPYAPPPPPSPGPRMHRLGSLPSLTPLHPSVALPSSPAGGAHRSVGQPPSQARSYPPPAGTHFYGPGGTDTTNGTVKSRPARSKSISLSTSRYSPASSSKPLPPPPPPRRNSPRTSLSSLALSSLTQTPSSATSSYQPHPSPRTTVPPPLSPSYAHNQQLPPHRSYSSPSIHSQQPKDHYHFDYVPQQLVSPPRSLHTLSPKTSFVNLHHHLSRRRSSSRESDGDDDHEEDDHLHHHPDDPPSADDDDDDSGGLGFEPRVSRAARGSKAARVRARWEAGQTMDGGSLGLMGLGGGGGSFSSALAARQQLQHQQRFGGAVQGGERSADERDVNVLSTDGEEPLPTNLLRPSSTPSSRLAVLASTPLVLLLLRLLSVVPSISGTVYLLGRVLSSSPQSQTGFEEGSRMECFIACFWSLLTATQCFLLTSGLTRRWLAYYSLPSTLLRLLSLQTICWPATSITLRLLGPSRPLVAWIVVGTTTSISNSIRLWVTSNIPAGSMVSGGTGGDGVSQQNGGPGGGAAAGKGKPKSGAGGWRGKRRMDWGLVVRQCVWPCLVGYMFTSWCLLVERDYSRRDAGSAGPFGE